MKLRLLLPLALTALAAACAPQPRPQVGPAAPPSVYASDDAWLCRPGREDACGGDLGALALLANGRREVRPFRPAASPAVDCFYVYPTVSADQTRLSDRAAGPEETRVARAQFARFASVCRTFAPIYRQVTIAGLNAALRPGAAPADWTTPYEDVREAWRQYLARDNGGRGVVLIGHSQGAIVLSRLLAEEIETNPAQRRLLVSAILAGHPGVQTPGDVGPAATGTPLCRRTDQIGCQVVYASYAADDRANPRFFGRPPKAGATAACVNPAAPAGGAGPLRSYISRPPGAPATDPPFVELNGAVVAQCVTDAQGSVLRLRVPRGPAAPTVNALFQRSQVIPNWGLHVQDIALAQGSLIDMVSTQSRAYARRGNAR